MIASILLSSYSSSSATSSSTTAAAARPSEQASERVRLCATCAETKGRIWMATRAGAHWRNTSHVTTRAAKTKEASLISKRRQNRAECRRASWSYRFAVKGTSRTKRNVGGGRNILDFISRTAPAKSGFKTIPKYLLAAQFCFYKTWLHFEIDSRKRCRLECRLLSHFCYMGNQSVYLGTTHPYLEDDVKPSKLA